MDKGLNLDRLHCRVPANHFSVLPAQRIDLLQRELSGRDDPPDPEFSQVLDCFSRCDGELGARVERQTGTCFMEGLQDTDVLDDHAVQSLFIQKMDELHQLGQLLLSGQHIGCQVDLPAQKMGFLERLQKLLGGKIIRICPGPEALASQVDSVRPGAHRSDEGFSAPGWRKKLCFIGKKSVHVVSLF